MNALTTSAKGTVLATTTAGYDPFAAAAADMGATRGLFLKFDGNEGTFSYGPKDDEQEIPLGTQLATNFGGTFKRGFICWKESEAVDEVMELVADGAEPTREADLEDHGPYETYEDGSKDGWRKQAAFELVDLESGNRFAFKASSASAYTAAGRLAAGFAKAYRQKSGMVPVVQVDADPFDVYARDQHGKKTKKKQGTKFAPSFKIVGWISMTEYDEALSRGEAAAEAEKTETDAGADAGSEDPKNYAEQKQEPAVEQPAAAATGRRAKRF